MTFADLRALHAILGDAINDIQRIYTPEHVDFFVDIASQTPNSLYASPPPSPSTIEFPLDFPSLDHPYDPNDPAEQLTAHPIVVTAINRIIAAAGQMAVTVQSPFYAICDAAMGYHLPSCLRLLEASHTVEILREAGSEGLHVDIISERNGVESGKLEHALRLLATHHIIRERSPNIFALNRISSLIDSGKSFQDIKMWEKEGQPEVKYRDTDGVGAFVGLCTDELFKSSSYLTEAYLHSRADSSRTPFEHAFNTDLGFFAWLEEEGWRVERKEMADPGVSEDTRRVSTNWNKFRLERFGIAMSGTGSWEAPGAVFGGFDWRSLPPGSVIVDVGGGIGFTSMLLANAFSHPSLHHSNATSDESESVQRTEDQELGFKFIIQDRPVVVEIGEKAWRNKCPEYLDSRTVEFQIHDFFTAQPVKNAAVFFLRVIMHDWPNAQARTILLRLREAARPDTKLVLADFVLPLACADDEDDNSISGGVEGAKAKLSPPPLLANLGKASANAYWMDLTMHVTFNSQERTLREIHALALSAGWKVVKVTHAPGSLFGHIVAVPVPIPSQGRATCSDVPFSNKAFQSIKDIDEGLRENTTTLRRASSRCGTPMFGSRTTLPSVQEKISRFGGVKSKVSRLAEKLKRPASGILKQAAVITTSATLGKKKPSPLSLSSPVRGSIDSSPGLPRRLQPPSPLTKKKSLMQLGSASPSHLSQRQSPPSPLSPIYPTPQSHQLGPNRNDFYTQPSQHVSPTTANPSSSPKAPLQEAPMVPRYQTLGRTSSYANLSPRSDSVSTISSILPSSPIQPQLGQLPHSRTLPRPKSHAQLRHMASSYSNETSVPIPARQPGNESVISQDSSRASPLHSGPNTSLTARSKSFPSPKPYQSAIHHRSSFAQLRPPQVTLRKRSGTLVNPIGSAGMDVGNCGRGGRDALDFGDGNDHGGSDRKAAYGQDRKGGGSLLAAAAVIDSNKGNSFKSRAKFANV